MTEPTRIEVLREAFAEIGVNLVDISEQVCGNPKHTCTSRCAEPQAGEWADRDFSSF